MKKNFWFLEKFCAMTGSKKLLGIGILLLLHGQVSAQQTVSGTVTDAADGSPLPGVTIMENGTRNGSATDIDGQYQFTVSEGAVLTYSFVGYKSEEVTVGASSVINVALTLDVSELQEVVVVGYGAVAKQDLTGVVATVDREEFNQGAITSPAELLAGKAAGVSVTTAGGIGNAPQVRIRGTSSINASSDPLYVIDGVIIDNGNTPGQRNPLNFINTEDIENITILKDASAAAIYGSRGAKGVIIITTRKGENGEPRISYDGYYSVSNFSQEADIMNPSQFRALIQSKYPGEAEHLGNASTNWLDEVTQTATGQKHAISFSNGDANSSIYVSLMHQTLNGVVRKDKIERNIFNLNYDRKFFDDVVEMRISLKNGFTKNNFGENQVGAAYDFNPTVPVRSDSSVFGGYYEPRGVGELGTQNPVARQNLTTNIGRSFRSLGKAEFVTKLPFINGLSWTNNISYDITNSKNRFFQPKSLFGVYDRGALTFDEALKSSILVETYANYQTTIANDHELKITAGYSYQTFNFEESKFEMDSLISDSYSIYDASQARVIKPRQGFSEIIQESYFGRLNYSMFDKYLATFNFRVDGSSQFGPKNRYGFFPSVALAWRVIDESFATFLTGAFDDLKIRSGYGVLGNQEFGSYLYETFYFLGTNDARYQFGSDYINTLRPEAVDPDIKWEVAKTINIGMDYTLKGGRVYGSLEFYQRNTEDLLFEVIVPAGIIVGDKVLTNVGSMVNRGVEFEMSARVFDKRDFRWNLSFNASHNQNEVTKITNGRLGGVDFIEDASSGISGDVGRSIQIIGVNRSLRTFYVLEHIMKGGKPVPDQGLNSRLNMYVDQNNDGLINEADYVEYKNANPDIEVGLTSNASYKNFALSFTIRGKSGNYVYNNVASSKGYFNRVTEFGPNNIHTSAFETLFNDKQLTSDYYVEDASFVRLDNITLSYSVDKLSFAKIRLYGTAQNVLTLTNYSGLDPEVANGIDNNLYPRSLNLIGGINVTF